MVRRVFEDSSVSTELKHEGTAGSTLLAEDQLQLPLLGTIGLRSDVVVVTKVQLVYTYSIWVSFRISLKQHSCLWSKADENNPLNKEEKQRIWANVSKTFQNLTLISLFNLHVLSSNDVWKCSSLENTIRVKHGDDSPLWWNLLRKQVPKSILMTPLCCADLQKMHLLQLMTASQKPLLIQTLDSASDSLEVDRWRRPWNKLPKNPSTSPEDTETGSSVNKSKHHYQSCQLSRFHRVAHTVFTRTHATRQLQKWVVLLSEPRSSATSPSAVLSAIYYYY